METVSRCQRCSKRCCTGSIFLVSATYRPGPCISRFVELGFTYVLGVTLVDQLLSHPVTLDVLLPTSFVVSAVTLGPVKRLPLRGI